MASGSGWNLSIKIGSNNTQVRIIPIHVSTRERWKGLQKM